MYESFELLNNDNVSASYSLAEGKRKTPKEKRLLVRGMLGTHIFDRDSLLQLEPVIRGHLGQTEVQRGEISVFSLGGPLPFGASKGPAWTASLDQIEKLLALGLAVGALEIIGDLKKDDPSKIKVKLKEKK